MDRKIKICFVLSHIPQGGYERQLLNLISKIDNSKFAVTLLLYLNDEIFYEEFKQLSIEIISRKGLNNKFINWISAIIFLYKTLKKKKYDIIQSGLFHNGFIIRSFVPLKFRRNLIYNIRNNLKNFSKIQIFFEKILLKNTIVTCNSLQSMNQFNSQIKLESKAYVKNIYNGIDCQIFSDKRSNIIKGKIVFGTVGRVAIQKNQIQILRVLKSLSNEFELIFYLIGSKGNNSKMVNEYIKKQNLEIIVKKMSPVNNINYYYRKFNIFILSSVYEGCPNVLFEAMLQNCICIISSNANSDNFIEDGINGYVYDGSDFMLRKKIKQAVEVLNNKKHLTIINNAQKYVKSNFSNEKMVDNYIKLYEETTK